MSTSIYIWHPITDSLPEEGKVKRIDVAGKAVCVGKQGGKWYAVDDFCPHAGISLGSGFCNAQGDVVCPMHHIAFDMKDGRNTTGEGYRPLTTFPIKEKNGKLLLGIRSKKWYQFWK